jgi:ABC-type transport system substrate-binding protein
LLIEGGVQEECNPSIPYQPFPNFRTITYSFKEEKVKQRFVLLVVTVFILASMLMTACQPVATPTAAPAPTQPVAAAATSAPAFTPLSLAAPDCNYGGNIKSISAPDANTVVFSLCAPDPAFPAKAAFAAFEILPKALLDSTGGDSAKIGNAPIGTGPFMLKEWVRGDHMTFVANPNYWGDKPTLQTLIMQWSKEPAQRLLELQSGNVDSIELVGSEDIPTVQADTTLAYSPIPPTNTLYFGMNNTKPPFDNEQVRQAFAMAIDKDRIVKNFFPAGSITAEQFLYPQLKPGFTDGLKWYPYDQAKAKQMLTDAGFDFSQTILFSYRQATRGYAPHPDQIAQDVQAQLAQIGVNIKLDVQESGTLIGNSGLGKLTFFLLGWGEDYPDATDWFDYHFGAASKTFGNPYPDLVAAIKQGASSADPAARQAAYDQVNKLIMQHVPMNPIAHGASGDAFKASVKNVVVGPYNINFPYLTTASGQLVWLQSGEPISLWCGDETDGETINACMNIYEPLLRYKYGTSQTEPALASSYEANSDLTQYTFHLRQGVKFSDGSAFTSADVFATYTAMWDNNNPNHKGNTGAFEYFGTLFGGLLNPPAPTATVPAPAATATSPAPAATATSPAPTATSPAATATP